MFNGVLKKESVFMRTAVQLQQSGLTSSCGFLKLTLLCDNVNGGDSTWGEKKESET